jgi:hypothetical protein
LKLLQADADVDRAAKHLAEVFATLRKGPEEFTRELRIAAAIEWYELELVSQLKSEDD